MEFLTMLLWTAISALVGILPYRLVALAKEGTGAWSSIAVGSLGIVSGGLVVLAMLGSVALGQSLGVSMVILMLIGWLMIGAGVVEMIKAFSRPRWRGVALRLLVGPFYVVAGFIIMVSSFFLVVVATPLIALFLIYRGIYKIIVAAKNRSENWGWFLLYGVVTLGFGTLMMQQWPSGLWVLGLIVGLKTIYGGSSLLAQGIRARRFATASATFRAT